MPLELFPPWLRAVTAALPFRYTVAFPVETIIGALDLARRSAISRCSGPTWRPARRGDAGVAGGDQAVRGVRG